MMAAGSHMPIDERSSKKRKRIAMALWCAVAVWAVFIFFMSAKSGADLSGGEGLASRIKQWLASVAAGMFGPDVDIVSPAAHFVEYAIFGALLLAALRWSFPEQRGLRLVIIAIVVASLYGVTDEFHQYFVPDRACDPLDWLIDTCGATLGVFTMRTVLKA